MKKFLSLLLAVIMVVSIFAVPTFAVEKDIAELGAPTQAEAVAWARSQVGVSTGQCVALVRNYYSFLGVSPVNGNGSGYKDNALPSGKGWVRIPYSSGLVVQPGDIIVWSYTTAGGNNGHVAIIIESNTNIQKAKMVTQNPGPAVIKDVSYVTGTIACVIRPQFGTHTHSYITHSHYGSDHPHYQYLKCSCGATQVNTSKTNYNSSCSKCPVTGGWVWLTKRSLPVGDTNTFTFGAQNAVKYTIHIECNEIEVISETATTGKTYTFTKPGDYTVHATCHSNGGGGDFVTGKVSFKVFQPLTYEESFYANISNWKAEKVISCSNNDVIAETANGNDNQKWLFELQSDNTYKITNKQTGLCLGVEGSSTKEGASIVLAKDQNLNSQRFYIRDNGYGYGIAPKHYTSGTLALTGNSYDDVVQWNWSTNYYLTFNIDYVDLKPSKTMSFNGNTYEYYDVGTSWKQAKYYCEQQGGHLVTISSKAENDFVYQFANNYENQHCWLGASDTDEERNMFRWVTGEDFSYVNWRSGQPDDNNDNEDFLHMYIKGEYAGYWNDLANDDNSYNKVTGFICEYESNEPKFTLGDVNGDGEVTVMDATIVQRHVAQLAVIGEDKLANADTDKDSKISVVDATMIQRFVAQLISHF